jgi:hypothetical protein
MGTPAPDCVRRLVDHLDQNRKVFLSSDYKEEQLRVAFPKGSSPSVRHSDLASAAPVGQRVVRTSPSPFFTALGWDMDRPPKDIIGNLYYPDSPYEFSVMSADVLGRVYEQFLGKVIRLTAGHQAKVDDRSKGLVPTRALDGSSAPRKLSAMPCEPRPALTEVELFICPRNSRVLLPHGHNCA